MVLFGMFRNVHRCQRSLCHFPCQVKDSKTDSAKAVGDAVSQAASLQKEGKLPISDLAKLFGTISDNLNSSYSEDDQKEVARCSTFGQPFQCPVKRFLVSTSVVKF